jgi:hypothetical protein
VFTGTRTVTKTVTAALQPIQPTVGFTDRWTVRHHPLQTGWASV